MNILAPVVLLLAPIFVTAGFLYFWGAVFFLFFRYSRTESEATCRRFLADHFEVLRQHFFSPSLAIVSRQDLKRKGSRGWLATGLPVVLLSQGISPTDLVLANGCLFFGGLILATSWYGLRCMRLLNLETLPKQDVLI